MSTSCSGLSHDNTLFSRAVHLTETHVIVSLDSQKKADYNGDIEQCARTLACIKCTLCQAVRTCPELKYPSLPPFVAEHQSHFSS